MFKHFCNYVLSRKEVVFQMLFSLTLREVQTYNGHQQAILNLNDRYFEYVQVCSEALSQVEN